MSALVPFIPLIASGIGALGSIFGAKSAGAPGGVNAGENLLGGIGNLATNQLFPATQQQAGQLGGLGGGLLAQGQQTMQPGVNFLQSLLGGNAANTAAALAPSINQTLQGINAVRTATAGLTPRGGGRFGSLFGLSFAPQAQIQSLFNQARMGAANALPGLGLQQIGAGSNLFGLANQALGLGAPALQVGAGAGGALAQLAQAQQAQTARLGGGIGSLLGGIATNLPGIIRGLPKIGGGGATSGGAYGGAYPDIYPGIGSVWGSAGIPSTWGNP